MTCAKTTVTAILAAPGGPTFTASNSVRNPQRTCPRVGDAYAHEDYRLCSEVCRTNGHAEEQVIRAAGLWSVGATLWVSHRRVCSDCARLIEKARIGRVIVGRLPEHD